MANGFVLPTWDTPSRAVSMPRGEVLESPVLRNPENRMYALKATEAPRVPWNVFIRETFKWKAGQHVALIGPTGQGKTTLLTQITPLHPYVVVFGTKPKDETMDHFLQRGYIRLERWRSLDPAYYPRRVLWPDATRLDSRLLQREVFTDAMDRIFLEHNWTVVIDETWYFVNELKMAHYIKLYLLQARSLGISLVNATQRPAFVPVEIYDQSTHLFFFRDNDETNLKRLSGISWRSADLIRRLIADLEEHQVLYVNTRTGKMSRTRSPAIPAMKREEGRNGYHPFRT